MYYVKYGEVYLHDPRTQELVILDTSFEGEENDSGHFEFTIHPNHPYYAYIRERNTDEPITVWEEEELLFRGFIYEMGIEFQLSGKVKCKGELAYLNETVVRPYSSERRTFGLQCPESVAGYFEWIIEQHNRYCEPNKQFKVGRNEGARLEKSFALFAMNDDYPTVYEELFRVLIDYYGGYLVLRYENGERIIDYISEWTEQNSQILDFGVNLTDYTQTEDSNDICTGVIPMGAPISETEYPYNDGYFATEDTTVNPDKTYYIKHDDYYSEAYDLTVFESGTTYYEYDYLRDETDQRITVSDLPDVYDTNNTYNIPDLIKSGDTIYSRVGLNRFGKIVMSVDFSDYTVKEDLVKAAYLYVLQMVAPIRSIEIKAVDMHMINPKFKPIRVGEYVRVRSRPHNFDSYMLCTSIDINLNNPQQSIYKLGTTYDTLTGEQNKRINELNAKTDKEIERVDKITDYLSARTHALRQQAMNLTQVQDEIDEAICALYEMSLSNGE